MTTYVDLQAVLDGHTISSSNGRCEICGVEGCELRSVVVSRGEAVLLNQHGDVHCHNGRGHTLCGRPVQAGNAVAVTNSQIMVYGLMLCAKCYRPASHRRGGSTAAAASGGPR